MEPSRSYYLHLSITGQFWRRIALVLTRNWKARGSQTRSSLFPVNPSGLRRVERLGFGHWKNLRRFISREHGFKVQLFPRAASMLKVLRLAEIHANPLWVRENNQSFRKAPKSWTLVGNKTITGVDTRLGQGSLIADCSFVLVRALLWFWLVGRKGWGADKVCINSSFNCDKYFAIYY